MPHTHTHASPWGLSQSNAGIKHWCLFFFLYIGQRSLCVRYVCVYMSACVGACMYTARACRAQRTASGLFFGCHPLSVLFQFVWRQGLLLTWGLLIWLSQVASNSKRQGFPLVLGSQAQAACLSIWGSWGSISGPHSHAASSVLTGPAPNLFYASAPNWSPTVESPVVMSRSPVRSSTGPNTTLWSPLPL